MEKGTKSKTTIHIDDDTGSYHIQKKDWIIEKNFVLVYFLKILWIKLRLNSRLRFLVK